MAWMACRSCSTRFAVGLLRCPQCGAVSELYAVPDYVADAEEENMPKITVAAGPSNALGVQDEPPVEPVASVAPAPEAVAEPESTVPEEEVPAESEAPAAEPEEVPTTADANTATTVEESQPEEAPSPAPKKRASRKPASGTGSAAGA